MGLEEKCPICLIPGPTTSRPRPDTPQLTRFECRRCGRFDVSDSLIVSRRFTTGEVVALSGIIRHACDHTKDGTFPEPITRDNVDRILTSSGAPDSVDGQIQAIIEAIGNQVHYHGEMTKYEHADSWVARAFLPEWRNLSALLDDVERSSSPPWRHKLDAGPHLLSLGLTLAGWRELGRLKRTHGDGTQCFVAMWFHPEMLAIYDAHIAKAVVAAGFKPYLVMRDPHDERIDNHILAQIRKSRLMIADFSGGRGGVYYEAGFAEGLGIPVMWCCNDKWETFMQKESRPFMDAEPATIRDYAERKKWSDVVHFDVRQLPFNFWSDGPVFEKKILDWIEARPHILRPRR